MRYLATITIDIGVNGRTPEEAKERIRELLEEKQLDDVILDYKVEVSPMLF